MTAATTYIRLETVMGESWLCNSREKKWLYNRGWLGVNCLLTCPYFSHQSSSYLIRPLLITPFSSSFFFFDRLFSCLFYLIFFGSFFLPNINLDQDWPSAGAAVNLRDHESLSHPINNQKHLAASSAHVFFCFFKSLPYCFPPSPPRRWQFDFK